MSAFYDLASVVLVPSGYKSGKIYAQKPLTTDGQLTFTRASTATRVNASGLIETVASGVPRLDYQGSTCPKLLLEPQRTNGTLYSEQFDNAAWSIIEATITSNTTATLDPTGYYGADKLVESSTNNQHVVFQSSTGTSATYSFFAKAAGRDWVAVLSNNGSHSFFNIANGTLGTIQSGSTATITSYGNGWYRCTLYNTHPSFGATIYLAFANGNHVYQGNGTSGAYIFGAQIEASATYATSYIPTTSAAVTRLADFAKKENIGGTLPTAYPFTLYSESDFYLGSDDFGLSMIDIGTTNIYYTFGTYSNKYIGVARGSAGEIVATSTVNYTPGLNKMAVVFTSSSIKVFANGALVATATNTLAFNAGVNDLIVGTLREAGDIGTRNSLKQALVFKSALTDAQCVELTTL